MKREKITKKQAILLLLSLFLVLILTAALATGLILAARERAALEREREEQSALADRLHAGVTRPKHPNNMSGLELIAAGNANLLFMGYFGDETLYGRGSAEELAINTVSYRTMVKEGLGDLLGLAPGGRIYDDNFLNPRKEPDHYATTFNPSLSLIAADLGYTAPYYSYRLMLLSPTARTAEAGMAKEFVKQGAKVVITGRDASRLENAKNEILEFGTSIETFQMDVREVNHVEAMVAFTVEKFGRIDSLVNNAAGNFLVHAEKLSANGWKAVIDIVLNGTFYCSSAVGRYWIENGIKGSMLNMVATYAWGAGAGVIHSAAAKAGVLSLTRTLAVEWGAQYGIRANAIAPGPIERTGGSEKLWESPEQAKRTINSVPLRRLGTPEEIADLAAFMLSDKAAYMNGECITLDGGAWLNQFPF